MKLSTFTVSAPGKVILHGEHSVVYGKTAIAVSLNLRTKFKVTQDSQSSYLQLQMLNQSPKEWDLNLIKNLEKLQKVAADLENIPELTPDSQSEIIEKLIATEKVSSMDMASVAVIFLAKSILDLSSGIKIEIESDIPIGAGLGSSASFAVCLSTAFLYISQNLHLNGGETGFSTLDFNLINKWAFTVEKIFHGRPSGIDNTTSSYGGAIMYRSGTFQHLQSNRRVKVLLVNTKIERNTKVIVEDVKKLNSKYPAIIEPILQSMDEISRKSIEIFTDKSISNEEFYEIFKDLIDLNQSLLNSLNVSHSKLQKIFEISSRNGFHAKLTGAGRGGFAFILITPETLTDRLHTLKSELNLNDFECFDVKIGGKGVEILL